MKRFFQFNNLFSNSNNYFSRKFYRSYVYNNKNPTNFEIDGASIIYKSLKKHDVKDIWIYSGGSIMPLIDKLYKSTINYKVNSHEQNCGHAATGYAKISGKPGVVFVTSGPGITNMITPMLDATNDSTPLVVFSGQVPLKAVGSNAFQEAPAIELSHNVTKWSYQVKNIGELDYIIDEAFYIANDGKKGAVHIDLPKCILSQKINYDAYLLLKKNNYDVFKYLDNKKKNFKKNYYKNFKIKNAIKLINKSEKPIIYLGQGCINDYKILREFAIKGNIPVTSTIHGNGIFDESHNLSLQWCGMHGNAAANYSLQDSDCIIALGSRFDDRTTGLVEKYAPNAFEAYKQNKGGIIHVNIENNEIKKVVKSHYNFNMTCGDFLKEGIKFIEFNKRKSWINNIENLNNKHKFTYKQDKNKLYMENVLVGLYNKTRIFKDRVTFTTGVGNHQMQAYQYIKSHYPKKILSSGSLGVMGAGLPYAIGVQVAKPKNCVICIDGDSSFNMTLTDMKTIVENDLPVKIAIMNNNAQMMVTIWEKLFFEERYTATINEKNPDFKSLAQSYGIHSISCDKIEDLDDTLTKFINYPKAILCEFKIEKGICLPLVGPGKALDDMILPENYDDNIKITEGMAPS